ncbi:MAG: aldehyde oxidase and xanthine dehydrogenase molybdopterin binding protein, partial [Rhizobacter sp.]|nr:aldehyde oxidase and xanthine dehydrogenase molybdopterin binding protein [Rhizobacter sp.]
MNESEQAHLHVKPAHGVGASLPRKEDERFMTGRGQFVGDIRLPGMLDVAFVRSPVAHGRLGAIVKPQGFEDSVFTMDDLAGVQPIRANTSLPGFKPSDQWPLARHKVRQVGETIAMCVAASRALAEDLAAQVEVDIHDLPAVVDMLEARSATPPALVHDEWGDNLFLQTHVDGDIDAIRGDAALVVRRHLRTSRQS